MKRAAMLVLLLSMAPLSWAGSRRTYPMEVPASGARTITFDVQEGDLVLRGDPTATAIRMQVSIDRYWLFKLGEAGILKRMVKVSGEGTEAITVRTDIPRAISNWGRAQYPVDFEVVVPAGVTLEVRDTSGKIEIAAMNGAVSIHDGSGTLAVRDVGGALRIEKESGDMRVSDIAGATTIRSRSGQLRLERLAWLQVTESDGNLEVSDSGGARLVNKGGNIRVTRARGDLEIDDESGEIQVRDATGKVKIRDTSGQIRAAHVGALRIDDTSGDIVVEDAGSVEVRSKESGQVKLRKVRGEVHVPAGITVSR